MAFRDKDRPVTPQPAKSTGRARKWVAENACLVAFIPPLFAAARWFLQCALTQPAHESLGPPGAIQYQQPEQCVRTERASASGQPAPRRTLRRPQPHCRTLTRAYRPQRSSPGGPEPRRRTPSFPSRARLRSRTSYLSLPHPINGGCPRGLTGGQLPCLARASCTSCERRKRRKCDRIRLPVTPRAVSCVENKLRSRRLRAPAIAAL